MSLIPHRFLFRVATPCLYVKKMPLAEKGRLLDLPSQNRIDNYSAIDGLKDFAEVALGWNELGLGLQVEVRGKQELPVGNPDRPRASDGVTLWLDTRDTRANHRASRHCHQFHFLASGGGPERDEPAFVQTNINRALEDALISPAASVLLKVQAKKSGYLLEAFLPAAALNGYDPEEHPRLGVFYSVHDEELGEQLLNISSEFPFWEDPSLWNVLDLTQ